MNKQFAVRAQYHFDLKVTVLAKNAFEAQTKAEEEIYRWAREQQANQQFVTAGDLTHFGKVVEVQ